MAKIITLIIFSLLVGCSSVPIIKTQTVNKPVIYVPEPPTVTRPNLEIFNLSEEDKKDIGKVSKAHGVDLVQLSDYVNILELIIDKYRELAKENPKINKDVYTGEIPFDEWNKINEADGFVKDIEKK